MLKPGLCAVFSVFHQVLPENIEQGQAPGEPCLQLLWNSWAAWKAAIKRVVLMRTALTHTQLNMLPSAYPRLPSQINILMHSGFSHMFPHPACASRSPAQIPAAPRVSLWLFMDVLSSLGGSNIVAGDFFLFCKGCLFVLPFLRLCN